MPGVNVSEQRVNLNVLYVYIYFLTFVEMKEGKVWLFVRLLVFVSSYIR